MSPVKLNIDDHNVLNQIRMLDRFQDIAARHTRVASSQAENVVTGGWRAIVHSVSGDYVGSIAGEVQQVVGLKSRAIVATDALAENRYPYPFMLEKSNRFAKTKGKVAQMLRRQRAAVEAIYAAALERIVNDLMVRG